MPTLEERVTRLEVDMAEQKRLRAGQDSDLSDMLEKMRVQGDLLQALVATQSQHTAKLDRHTAMHNEHSANLARMTLDVHGLKDGVQQIIGMLDILIEQDGRR